MMEPRPLASMPGRNALMVRCIDLTLRSKEKSHPARGVEHRAVMHEARRIEQHVDRARAASPAPRWRLSRASSFTHSATPASFRPAIPASLRSLAITLAPSRAKAMAVARPMPALDAVQNATLPLSRSVILCFLP